MSEGIARRPCRRNLHLLTFAWSRVDARGPSLLLLAQLHSTHDKAEWFTPVNSAVAGLTAEQAKWVPQSAQGKLDPAANHSVGMLAYAWPSGTRKA